MTQQDHMATWPFNLRLMRYAPGSYALYWISNFIFLAGPVVPGLVVKAIFDRLTGVFFLVAVGALASGGWLLVG